MNIAHLREEYRRERLDESDVAADPLSQFHRWFSQARAAEVQEPNAMALATAAADGTPNVRMVLLKDADHRGFVFFTDYRSRKAGELEANAKATLCFWWGALERQVRIAGSVERVSPEESAAYFKERPRGSQLGAWTSTQSTVIGGRESLEATYAEAERRFAGADVPLPPHWGGFRLLPEWFEFWQGRPSRLHDRLRYRPVDEDWVVERLSP
ncbi:MAG: pyridoxamine 5'-phosphate oxidase [Gemmatimonadaceae bacterium]